MCVMSSVSLGEVTFTVDSMVTLHLQEENKYSK
jgi:hypothetical protein